MQGRHVARQAMEAGLAMQWRVLYRGAIIRCIAERPEWHRNVEE